MPANSYSNAVEEIKSRCNIVDVIGSLVTLKHAGDSYKACCPFHNEKTPSFVVSEKKQFYHCFGCGESGDAFTFLQKYYHITFPEAVEKLAAQYGVVIEREDTVTSKKRDELFEANRLAARYFFSNIKNTESEGYKYITKRGILPETIKSFGLGYAGSEWDGLVLYLKKNGVSTENMLELGLVSKSAKNGKLYDKYRNRLIFPIINTRSKIIGFGGRIIGDGEPKYLNSPESTIFLKKNNLFGLDKAKDAISAEGYAFLVEGYMDMVSLYQNGVKNVVASLGTALTDNQAKLLHRYCSKVILCYDADAAGIKAALRGIDVLRAAEMEVKVLHVDDGKDPDEYVKKHGKEGFIRLASNKALSDVDYKVLLIGKKYNINDREQNIKFLKAVAGVLRTLSPVEQEVYIKELSARFGISENALLKEVQLGESKTDAAEKPKTEEENKTEIIRPEASKSDLNLEKMILRLSLIKSEYFSVFQKFDFAYVSDSGMRIRDVLNQTYREGQDYDLQALKDLLEDKEYDYLRSIMKNVLIGDEAGALKDCLSKLEKRQNAIRLKEIETSIQMLEELPEDDRRNKELNKLMQELIQLRRK